jgi:ubiquinone/menaquinone biosynthesis C-methylase UbiE
MIHQLPFNDHVAEYEAWFEKHPMVFLSEVEAIRHFLPANGNLRGIEIGAGTGRFSKELGIKEGIEPAPNMRAMARKRGVDVISGKAEHLPYYDNQFDFVLMAFCISYFEDLSAALKEATRVLKPGGSLVLGFIDKYSIIGRYYEQQKAESLFYKNAVFYSVRQIKSELKKCGFGKLKFVQTLFKSLDEINTFEPARLGYGSGSFVVVKAIKYTEYAY